MLKKILMIIGALVGLFIVAAILLPVFVDANKYRPQIEKLVEDNMNADLQLGKLSLSLWGGLHIGVEKLTLSEQGSRGEKPIMAFKDFNLNISLLSVLTGKPNITLAVKKPEITVVMESDGKLNVAKIAKPAAPGTPQAAASTSKSGAPALPFELSFKILDGKVIYADQIKKTKTEIDGINFELNKFGLNKQFTFSFDSNLDSKEMKDLTLRGAAKFNGTAAIYMSSAGLDKVDLDTNVDLSGLIIKYAALFNKTEKAPLKIVVKLSTTTKNLNLEKAHLEINDAAIDVSGKVDNFAQPVVDLKISSTQFVFDHWQQVLAPLKQFDMKGSANFNIKATGPIAKLNLEGKANAENISLNAPGLVPRITDLNSTLQFSSDTASLTKTSLKMGASDLQMDGTVKNFNKPIIVFNVRSSLLDVDSLLPQKPAVAVEEKQAAAPAQEMDMEKSAKGPIAALKANPMARALDFTGKMQIAKLKAHKAELTDVKAELTFKNLVMSLKQASANTFGGSGSFNTSIDFKGNDPVYTAGGQVTGVDINAAVSNQMPVAKDSIFGKVFAKFDVAGSGLSKAKVNGFLKGKGNFRIDNGSWSAFKAMQQVGEALKKIPGAQAALGNINVSDKFKDLKSDFTIANGRLNITNMIADMEGARTTLTGQGFVTFDMDLSMAGKLTTPAGGDIPKDLRSADGRLSIPYELGCKATAPCPKMEPTAKLVAGAYAKQMGGQAVKKALQDNIQNGAVKDLLNKLPF